MSYTPSILHPEPDPAFVRELHKIDKDLRVVWGYSRYLVQRWVIERKLSPERYFACYASFLESDAPRYVQQPIYDEDQPIVNEFGEEVGHQCVGYRRFDLAPEYECVMVVKNEDETFRPLDSRTILALKRTYAYERFHSISRLKFEKEQAKKEAEAKAREKAAQEAMDDLNDHKREIYKLPFVGQPTAVMEGTSIN